MDINALLQMLQGGSSGLQGGSGGISAPQPAQMTNPTLQMPQFAGAGSNAGPQQVAAMAHQALMQQPQQQPTGGGMDPSQMGMFAMLHKMQQQNQPAPSMALNNIQDMRGNPMPQTVQAPMPDISGSQGLQGLLARMFG